MSQGKLIECSTCIQKTPLKTRSAEVITATASTPRSMLRVAKKPLLSFSQLALAEWYYQAYSFISNCFKNINDELGQTNRYCKNKESCVPNVTKNYLAKLQFLQLILCES